VLLTNRDDMHRDMTVPVYNSRTALNMQSDWFFLVFRACHFLKDCRPTRKSCCGTEKLHDAVVKFDMNRNVQRHHAVLHAIAWLLFWPACSQSKREQILRKYGMLQKLVQLFEDVYVVSLLLLVFEFDAICCHTQVFICA